MIKKTKININRVYVSSPNGCQVKEKCDNDAYYFIGSLSICEKHLKVFCELSNLDFNEMIAEFESKEVKK